MSKSKLKFSLCALTLTIPLAFITSEIVSVISKENNTTINVSVKKKIGGGMTTFTLEPILNPYITMIAQP